MLIRVLHIFERKRKTNKYIAFFKIRNCEKQYIKQYYGDLILESSVKEISRLLCNSNDLLITMDQIPRFSRSLRANLRLDIHRNTNYQADQVVINLWQEENERTKYEL